MDKHLVHDRGMDEHIHFMTGKLMSIAHAKPSASAASNFVNWESKNIMVQHSDVQTWPLYATSLSPLKPSKIIRSGAVQETRNTVKPFGELLVGNHWGERGCPSGGNASHPFGRHIWCHRSWPVASLHAPKSLRHPCRPLKNPKQTRSFSDKKTTCGHEGEKP